MVVTGTRMDKEPPQAFESIQAYFTLKHEVSKGREQVKQLKAASSGDQEKILERMLASYEEVWSILNEMAAEGKDLPVIPPSSDSPASGKSVLRHKRGSYKRKSSDSISVRRHRAPEELDDDGYCWRKYGQKDILGAKYPRSYFRCLYRYTQGCMATKQVQRSDDEPLIYDTTYTGKHSCSSSAPIDKETL
ncbi:probable WRKY transcription factor 30 isoform X1 [Sesamum indicum]|uniref:Probable WRKY transcription factor 30 isoform X1 n=2 Tax=Sesamum indicum TaxID=4182 RepID=A0A8M8UU82_SESIN|nr:probable WRKY transcription factor 30 isoform X1 [Sesamum indicum]